MTELFKKRAFALNKVLLDIWKSIKDYIDVDNLEYGLFLVKLVNDEYCLNLIYNNEYGDLSSWIDVCSDKPYLQLLIDTMQTTQIKLGYIQDLILENLKLDENQYLLDNLLYIENLPFPYRLYKAYYMHDEYLIEDTWNMDINPGEINTFANIFYLNLSPQLIDGFKYPNNFIDELNEAITHVDLAMLKQSVKNYVLKYEPDTYYDLIRFAANNIPDKVYNIFLYFLEFTMNDIQALQILLRISIYLMNDGTGIANLAPLLYTDNIENLLRVT
jgi:hypothetical protein